MRGLLSADDTHRIGIGLVTPEVDREAMRQEMGMGGGRGGGGKGGGGRGGGGRQGGSGGRGGFAGPPEGVERPDPLDLWATVTLAAELPVGE